VLSLFSTGQGSVAQPTWGRRDPGTRNKFAKIFTGAWYQVSTVKKRSLADDVIDWPSRTKFLAALLTEW